MKKNIMIVAALFVAINMFAQDVKNIQWGVKGGSNFAAERVGKKLTDSRIGFHAGGFIEKSISNRIGIQFELLYSMQGSTYQKGSTDYTDKMDYINVPLMAKIYVTKNRKLSIDAGPQIGYMISAKYIGGSEKKNAYKDDRLQKFDASLGLGMSYTIKGKFDLVLRGTGGFIKIDKKQDHRNIVGQFGIGYKF